MLASYKNYINKVIVDLETYNKKYVIPKTIFMWILANKKSL